MSRSLRLGIFIVATVVMFAAGVFWIGSRKFLFSHTYRLNAEFPIAAGLTDGAEVRVGGVHAGSVRHVILPTRPDQKIRVEMDLKGNTRDVVKKDSVAAIRTEGLVGDQYVEVAFGSNDAPAVESGDTIQAQPPLELADLIRKTNGILDSAGSAMQNVNHATANLGEITGKINEGKGSVGALINDRSVYQHINNAASSLQEDMEAMKHNFLTRGFFKKRGYEDATDITKNQIGRLPGGEPAKRFAYPAPKLFDKDDSAKLKKEKMLDEAGRYLEANPNATVVVVARSDQKGDTEKERTLTEARASVAREYLVEHFKVDDTKVKTLGLGKSAEAPEGGELQVLVYPGTAVAAAGRK